MPTGENVSILNYYSYFFQFQEISILGHWFRMAGGLGLCITKFPHDADPS